MRLDVYVHHVEAEQDVVNRLTALEQTVKLMSAVEQALRDGLKKVDDETTKMGARLDELAAKVANGVSPEVGAQIAQELNALGDRMEVMATNPDNPVPQPLP